MKILYIGNHNIGVMCLNELIHRGHEVVAVIGIPEDPNEKNYYASVVHAAKEHAIQAYTPQNVNNPDLVNTFRELQPDLITVISYRQILRKPIIDIPTLGVINLHGALLPKFRGGSPINWALIKGEKETGVTIHYIDEGVDTGPIIKQSAIPIAYDDTVVTLFDKVTQAGFEIFQDVIGYFESGDVPKKTNIKADGSYYRRRTPEQGLIDWNQDAVSVYNLIRALVPPFPGAFSYFDGRKVIIEWGLPVSVSKATASPGEIIVFQHMGQHAIATGGGAILPQRVNVEGLGSGPPEELFQLAGIEPGSVLRDN